MTFENTSAFDVDLSGVEVVAKICTVEVEGELEHADVARLLEARPTASTHDRNDLQKIRERHHTLAQYIAQGMDQRMAASLVGMTESRVSIILNSPAMEALVESYRGATMSTAERVTERMRTLGMKAAEMIEDQLEKADLRNEDVSISDLAAVAKLGLDRGGHGPTSKVALHSQTHIFDHGELRRLELEARGASADRITRQLPPAIEHQPEPGSSEESLPYQPELPL